jgi:tetratricopeptide (TPR) repeat protein
MDWVSRAAGWLRDLLGQQPWLDALALTIAQTPDWTLVATAPVFVATLLLLVLIMGPRGPREPRTKQPEAQPALRVQSAATLAAASAPKAAAPLKSNTADRAATAPPTTTASDIRVTGIPADSDQDRGVRVFVSSTFLDMQGERDELVGTTFLDLRRQFRERGVELLEVDLRWGVTEQDVTLDVCLSEVNRCKPYFIGLLGQRYGTLLTDTELTPELQADYPVLQGAVGRSLTEIEIMQGVLNDPDTAKRALFFERDPAWLDTLDEVQRATFEETTDEARTKLADLKSRIRSSAASVHQYKTPKDVGDAVKTALSATLEASFPEADAPDAFTQTHRLHTAYARDRLGPHIGAELYLDRLDQWMSQADGPPLLITGASGGGKSKLIAKWLQAQRAKSGNDILFAHYLGASPDSADPMQVMRRLWEHLNRATGESVELPGGDADLMDVASGLVQRIAQASVLAQRNDCRILIALDGLDKLASESNLRWLPSALPPRVKLVASSLDGEAKNAALARGWSALEVKPLNAIGQSAFIASTLKLWGKSDLPPARKQRILAHPLAGLPLFLRTVLEELRVSATNAVLDARLDDYLKARTMPDLFAGVLGRLERECGQALVARALALIEASRAGLEETEIIAITGTTPLAWAKLRNGLGDSLRDQAGRVAFAHDYLSQAARARYLASGDTQRAAHLAIADQFDNREPDERQAEELPYQLEKAEAWERLEALLVDLDRFELLLGRGDRELISYWLPLKMRGRDPEALLCGAFEARAGGAERWSQEEVDFAFVLGIFLDFAGATGDAHQRLDEMRTTACEHLLGPEHPSTLTSMNNLASTLNARGDLDGAQTYEERVLEARTRILGPEHPDTLTSMNNLASTLKARGDLKGAQRYMQRVLEARTRILGPEHPDTLNSLLGLASTLKARGDLEGAQTYEERVLEARTRILGPEHPDTLTSMSNLAVTLNARGDLAGAQRYMQRVLEARARILGPEHPDTLTSMNNLALTLKARGDLAGAQTYQERVLETETRILGLEHPDTLTNMNNLASTLYARGDLEGAQTYEERVLEARTRILGPEHPDTLTSMSNLALTLKARGDLEGAQRYQERVLEAQTRILGLEHPDTLTNMNNLASTLYARGDLDGALQRAEHVHVVAKRRFGSEHPLSKDTSEWVVRIKTEIEERTEH